MDLHHKYTSETWNKVASLYEDRFMNLNLYDETYDFICRSIVKKHAGILDIGCGPGNIARYLLKQRPDFCLYGIDAAPNMIKLAEKNNPSAMFNVMDARQICRLDIKFDGIVCGFCLPYLSFAECRKLISDIYGLLNRNGIFYLSFVNGDPDSSGPVTGSSGDSMYFYYHRTEDLKIILAENGFKQPKEFQVNFQKSETVSETHTILITRKK